MRIYLDITPNTETVPYDCQAALVGALHKWLGADNPHHDDLSLYSMSWLKYPKHRKGGMAFPEGSMMFIASPKPEFLYQAIKGIQKDPAIRWGMEVSEIRIRTERNFGERACLFAENAVLVKDYPEPGKPPKFLMHDDPKSTEVLTAVMQRKLAQAGLGQRDIRVAFDAGYKKAVPRLVTYKGIDNKASLCPVILEGDPEAIAFAYDAGVGHSTGIGFGALR